MWCSSCGRSYKEGIVFCPICGNRLSKSTDQSIEKPQSIKRDDIDDKSDKSNKASILDGGSIRQLRSFYEMQHFEFFIGSSLLYYLITKYWPKIFAEQLRKSDPLRLQIKTDEEVFEICSPGNLYIDGKPDWVKLGLIVSAIERTHEFVLKEQQ
jgi:hypothetical protein